MRRTVVLITGAAGEIGRALVHRLAEEGSSSIVALDIQPPEAELSPLVDRWYTGSITDRAVTERILAEYAVDRIYHLAALLSTRGEFIPAAAHGVNVDGTLNLLEFAQSQGSSHGRRVRFFYPSSIAVYGVPPADKLALPPLRENDWNQPITMYGCNKLYCEHLGRYFAAHYRQLDVERTSSFVDFRALRFPGLISAVTVPSGGTSDFAPEMLHAAAASKSYACFVREDSRIPFMTMSDAIESIFGIMAVDAGQLRQSTYNIASFNPSAGELRDLVVTAFPDAKITFEPDVARQRIVDSWPGAVDVGAAQRDWGFAPKHDLGRAFEEYLLPTLKARYGA